MGAGEACLKCPRRGTTKKILKCLYLGPNELLIKNNGTFIKQTFNFFSESQTDIPADFIIRLLEIILKFNIFEFNSEFFIQLIGTAMGTRPAVSYANIFMARKIDDKIVALATQLEGGKNPLLCLKRFLEDIFTRQLRKSP